MKKCFKFLLVTIFFIITTTLFISYANEGDNTFYTETLSFTNCSLNKKLPIKEVVLKEAGFYDVFIECLTPNLPSKICIITYKDNNGNNDARIKINSKQENVFLATNNTKLSICPTVWADDDNSENKNITFDLNFKFMLHNKNDYTTISNSSTPIVCDEYNNTIVKYTPAQDGIYSIKVPEYKYDIIRENDESDKLYDYDVSYSYKKLATINGDFDHLMYVYEEDENGQLSASKDINQYLWKYRFINGNHSAIDVPNFKKDKTYYIVLNLYECFAYLVNNCENRDSTISVNLSIKPCELESFSLKPTISSKTRYMLNKNDETLELIIEAADCYIPLYIASPYIYPKFQLRLKYKDEEETVLNDLFGSYNPVLSQTFNRKISSSDKYYKNQIGKYTLAFNYLGKKSTSQFEIKSFYNAISKINSKIKLNGTVNISKSNKYTAYKVFTPTKTGYYNLYSTTKKASSKISSIIDKNDNGIIYNRCCGYKLKKGVKYAIYISGTANETTKLIQVTKPKHELVTTKKGTAATYTHTGKTAQKQCAICDAIIQKQKVIPKKVLPKPTITKAKLASKKTSATIAWKVKKGKYYYHVQYATNKKITKSVKTMAVKSKKSSLTIKKLSKNKKYYVRVRSVIKEGKKTVYGKWSSIKLLKK